MTRKTWLWLTFLYLATAPALAQTTVPGGTISTDTTWNLAGSPYTVTGTVTIEGTDGPDGVTTLTIEPGVEVQFEPSDELVIGLSAPGALIADGNSPGGPSTILFTTTEASPSGPQWDGFRFGANARASTLRNLRIEYSGRGINFKGAIRVEASAAETITIDDVTVTESGDSFGSALFVNSGTVQVTNSTFETNASYDLRFFGGTVSVQNSQFESMYFNNNATTQTTFDGNTINNWGQRISRLTPNVAATLATLNAINPAVGGTTHVVAGTQSIDGAWSPELGELNLKGAVTVQGFDGPDGVTNLTIEGGTRVVVDNFHELVVGTSEPGSLIVDGDSGATPGPVVFTTADPAPVGTEWGGLWIRGQSTDCTLRNLILEHAGRGAGQGSVHVEPSAAANVAIDRLTIRNHGNLTSGLHIEDGNVTVTDALFENVAQYHVRMEGGTGSVTNSSFSSLYVDQFGGPLFTVSGNTITNWGDVTSQVSPDIAARLLLDNTVTPVANAETDVIEAVMSVDGSFGPQAGTYVLQNLTVAGTDGPDATTTLQLQPGTQIEVRSSRRIEVGTTSGTPGRLVAAGGGAPVTIRSTFSGPFPSAWSGITVRSSASASLNDVFVESANIGLSVSGTFEATDLSLERMVTGMSLSSATTPTTLERIRCNAVTTCIASSNSTPIVRDSDLTAVTGVSNNTFAQVVDARQNWWGEPDGPSGFGPGSGSAVTDGVLFDPWNESPDDDFDAVPADDGDGLHDPCVGGNTIDCDDNCLAVPNDSQADADGDGIGDACELFPVLTVSSDPADGADFERIQAAADAALPGTLIRIFPGLSDYTEEVRIDRNRSLVIEGVAVDPPQPVVIDSFSNNRLMLINSGEAPHVVRNLTFRGAGLGVDVYVDSLLEDLTFEPTNTFVQIRLNEGQQTVRRCRIIDAGTAITVERDVVARVEGCEITGSQQGILNQGGDVTVVSSILSGGTDGILMNSTTATATLEFVTIAGNSDRGIDNPLSATVTISDSILFGNSTEDRSNIPCSSMTRTNIGDAACVGINGNLSADPLLGSDWRLTAGSPCSDVGEDASTFSGSPARDVDGQPRLADANGDGIIRTDCGADEVLDANPAIEEVQQVTWIDEQNLTWDSVASAAEYHVYGGDVATLSPTSFGTCQDGLDADRTDTMILILETPLSGAADFYLVTAEDSAGNESTLGYGTSSQRPLAVPCP